MKVTVITATTGNPLLAGCLRSVRQQTYGNINHLVVGDGPEHWNKIDHMFYENRFPNGKNEFYLQLPYPIGKDRWNAHRIYPAATYMAEGDFVMYLDEDNTLEPTHIEDCIKTIQKGNDWAFSFRKIVDKEGNYLCNDDCESLGKWPSILDQNDYFVDVNCYFLPRQLAINITPVWYRKFREPGQMEVDRALCYFLRKIAPKYDSTYKYTVNYTVGNTVNSVQAGFFEQGNRIMLQAYDNKLPWKQYES